MYQLYQALKTKPMKLNVMKTEGITKGKPRIRLHIVSSIDYYCKFKA